MTAEEREASLDRLCEQDAPPGDEEDGDFEPFTAEELAEISRAAADDLLAVEAATTGRRGPGQPGSARVFPGESASPTASFGPGMALDLEPGGAGLAAAADAAAVDDGFAGVSDAELVGVLCAWDRVEAHAAARKLAAVAELPGVTPARKTRSSPPISWPAHSGSPGLAPMTCSAWPAISRPGCRHRAALLDGTISVSKTRLIATATALLDPDEAAAAEDKVLDRAARLTPGGLRAAIARAVIEAAPEKARERRETAARFARVERWAEDSGNAALMGRELPPDEVLAADQRICWWAGELRRAGLEGGMDELRARAYLDLLLGQDSRPRPQATAARGGPEPAEPGGSPPPPAGPGGARRRAGSPGGSP